MTHFVDYDKVISSLRWPEVIRDSALALTATEYGDVGTFLSLLSPKDLESLVMMAAHVSTREDTEDEFDCLIILGEMLAQHEGVPLDLKETVARTANLIILLNFEDLARKGVITFHRELASLGGALNPAVASIKPDKM